MVSFSVGFISNQHVSSSQWAFGEQPHGTNINLRDRFWWEKLWRCFGKTWFGEARLKFPFCSFSENLKSTVSYLKYDAIAFLIKNLPSQSLVDTLIIWQSIHTVSPTPVYLQIYLIHLFLKYFYDDILSYLLWYLRTICFLGYKSLGLTHRRWTATKETQRDTRYIWLWAKKQQAQENLGQLLSFSWISAILYGWRCTIIWLPSIFLFDAAIETDEILGFDSKREHDGGTDSRTRFQFYEILERWMLLSSCRSAQVLVLEVIQNVILDQQLYEKLSIIVTKSL